MNRQREIPRAHRTVETKGYTCALVLAFSYPGIDPSRNPSNDWRERPQSSRGRPRTAPRVTCEASDGRVFAVSHVHLRAAVAVVRRSSQFLISASRLSGPQPENAAPSGASAPGEGLPLSLDRGRRSLERRSVMCPV